MLKFIKRILKKNEEPDLTLTFQDKFALFRKIIADNDEAHKAMSEMGEMIVLAEPFSRSHANKVFKSLVKHTSQIVNNLILLSGGKFTILKQKLDAIIVDSNKILNPKYFCPEGWDCPSIECHICPKIRKVPEQVPYYYDLDSVDKSHFLEIGSKMSRLGEIKNNLKMNVPDGFCLTVKLFDEIMTNNNLRLQKDNIFEEVDFRSVEEIRRAARNTQNLFISNPFPKEIEDKILEIFDFKFKYNVNTRVAVRSSALGEDSDKYSFAGLHHSELNVDRSNLIDAVYEVMVSKYSPESIVYRFINGLRDEDMPMCVGCLEMIDAETAGVLFTKDPNGEKKGIIIQAVRGLGLLVVEGRVTPQEYIVEHSENADILSFSAGKQTYKNIAKSTSGLVKNQLPLNLTSLPCLSNEQVKELIKGALIIERHFDGPQDIEWAFDKQGKLYILQARPLKVTQKKQKESIDLDFKAINEAHKILIEGGEVASHGIASGQVRVINSPHDFNDFPNGGLLVSKRNVPEFSALIHRASGVITDFGSTTGHLSIIAREMGVPILTNTRIASSILKNGMVITLDADRGNVYEGEVKELIELKSFYTLQQSLFLSSPLYKIWHRLSRFIFKLNLYDPDSPKFLSKNCETLHDIIRFSHETSIHIMFSMFRNTRTTEGKSYELRFNVPLDIHVINLDKGLKSQPKRSWIDVNDINSKPFIALVNGMTTPGIRWSGHLPIDTKGYASIIFGNLVDVSRNDSEIGAKSYALLSENYFNFFSRLGYHFTRIDVFASDEINGNFINFNFRGGAADDIRKNRRARAVKKILDYYGFDSEANDDSVIARIRKIPEGKILELAEMLGRLMGAVRNTDITMQTESHVERFVQYFIEGDPAPALRFQLD